MSFAAPKTSSRTDPLHVSVGAGTPVHVHVSRRGGGSNPSSILSRSLKMAKASKTGGGKKKKSSSKKSKKSSSSAPFIPAPGLSTKPARSMRRGNRASSRDNYGPSTVIQVDNGPDPALIQQLSRNRAEARNLSHQVDDLRNEIDLERSMRDMRDKEDAITSARQNIAAAALENDRLRERIQRMREADSEQIATRDLRRQESNIRARAMADLAHDQVTGVLEEQRATLLEKIAELEDDNLNLKAQLRSRDTLVDELVIKANLNAELQRELLELRTNVADSKNRLEDRIRKATLDSIAKDEEINRLLQQNGEAVHQAADAQALAGAAESAQDTVRREAKKLKSRLLACEDQLAKERSAKAAKGREIVRLQGERDSLEAEMAKVKSDLAKFRTELDSTRVSKDEAVKLNRRLDGINKETTADLEKTKEELRAFKEVHMQKEDIAKAEIAQKEESIKQFQALVNEYKVQTEGLREELRQLTTVSNGQVKKISDLEAQQVVNTEKMGLLDSKLTGANRLIDELQNKLSAEEENAEKLRAHITELTAKMESLSKEARGTSDDLRKSQEDRQDLQRKLERKNSELMDLSEKIARVSTNMQKLEDAAHIEKTRAETAIDEHTKLGRKFEKAMLQAKHDQENSEIRADENRRAAEERAKRLESELARMRRMMENVQTNKAEVERKADAKMQELKERLDYANTSKRSLANYVDYVKTSYDQMFPR